DPRGHRALELPAQRRRVRNQLLAGRRRTGRLQQLDALARQYAILTGRDPPHAFRVILVARQRHALLKGAWRVDAVEAVRPAERGVAVVAEDAGQDIVLRP